MISFSFSFLGLLFPPQSEPRGVNTKKINDIIEKLCPHMEPVKRSFWLDIEKRDEAADLQNERDEEENEEYVDHNSSY